jgi:hypothetical protein
LTALCSRKARASRLGAAGRGASTSFSREREDFEGETMELAAWIRSFEQYHLWVLGRIRERRRAAADAVRSGRSCTEGLQGRLPRRERRNPNERRVCRLLRARTTIYGLSLTAAAAAWSVRGPWELLPNALGVRMLERFRMRGRGAKQRKVRRPKNPDPPKFLNAKTLNPKPRSRSRARRRGRGLSIGSEGEGMLDTWRREAEE